MEQSQHRTRPSASVGSRSLRWALAVSGALAGVGCGQAPPQPTGQSSSAGGSAGSSSGGAGSQLDPQGFAVHEWGTFTSVVGSSGERLPGLQHEDEKLPAFVIGRSPSLEFGKAMEMMPGPVTQKMETPVLYFHSAAPLRVDVDVTFQDGIISQWYPEASSFWPAIGEATAFSGGNMRWQVDLIPGENAAPIPVPEDNIWAPSRRVDSAPVRVDDEVEQFIFYRGLGDFDVPLEFDVGWDSVSLKNRSEQVIPAAFHLYLHAGGGSVTALGSLAPGATLVAQGGPKELELGAYVATAKELLLRSLVETGLFEDEAQAMVDTWAKSYFLTPGQRILYVLPEAWTAELLPLKIAPTPDALVRTLVGRVEILTGEQEAQLMQTLRGAYSGELAFSWRELGTFAEPQLQRALELEADAGFQGFVQSQILDANLSLGAE